ncbi:uncharacterized protein K444DRAFT_717255 [Hyaloscypha bicolor E]|uniref:Uncharacterized protein n=1 Tax=Hyaloscypha bicolor E TaxID=1095630 RepID=A0A2J6THJ1_9HELO|nr:uncharacterized protein K444DRAFT_717255 [Hyaloscypha bicolor E]PMD62496.1 hypothetical protein K444DRAFT_717255 [Hyaloscypha bicolor E]
MAFGNFSTKWYRDPDKFYRDPEPKWGPKVYPTYTPQTPTHTLPIINKLTRTLPSSIEIMEAIAKLAAVMSYITDIYGLAGGSAAICYATAYRFPTRLTTDINLIIQPDLDIRITAEEVARILCCVQFSDDFAVKNISGVDIPQVKVMRGKKEVLVDVEILDYHVWEDRRTDYDLSLSGNERWGLLIEKKVDKKDREESGGQAGGQVVDQIVAQNVFLMNAVWMLRQKILMWNEREGLQRANDKVDIVTLCDVLDEAKRTLKIRNERDIRKLKEFLKDFDNDPMVLGSVIECPEVFGPWYNLKWVRRTFAGFLFFAIPLAVDYYTATTQ